MVFLISLKEKKRERKSEREEEFFWVFVSCFFPFPKKRIVSAEPVVFSVFPFFHREKTNPFSLFFWGNCLHSSSLGREEEKRKKKEKNSRLSSALAAFPQLFPPHHFFLSFKGERKKTHFSHLSPHSLIIRNEKQKTKNQSAPSDHSPAGPLDNHDTALAS